MAAKDTRENLIDAAYARFYRDGFRNTGLDQILSDVGISKAAFYRHFESKDDLMVAVLRRNDSWLQNQFREMIREHAGRSAADQLRGLFDVVHRMIEEEEYRGCIFVNAVMEFPLQHDPAHQAALNNRLAIEDLVFELAERAGAADPGVLAQELCLIMEGVYVTRSITHDPGTIEIARGLADRVVDAHLEPTDQVA